MGGLTPIQFGKQVWNNVTADEVSVRSGSLAYYFVLAVFPAMLFCLSVIGLFAKGSSLPQTLFSTLARLLPASASDLVRDTIREVTIASGTGKAIFGILGALWSASSGFGAIMQSLNVAYKVREDRPFWKQKLIAVGLTLALSILVLGAMSVILFGGKAVDFIGSHLAGNSIVVAWKVFQWPLAFVFMFIAFAATYYFAPNLEKPEWHWITPGSVVGLAIWLSASFGFKLYLRFFNSYSKTYGSLGAVIILLLWLYITGFTIMIGGEVNSEIGRAAAPRNTSPANQSKLRSSRRPREVPISRYANTGTRHAPSHSQLARDSEPVPRPD